MSLDELRREIDRIDTRIIHHLNKRARVAIKVGKEKRKHNSPVRDPQREDMVLKRAMSLSKGPLTDKQIRGIYRRVIVACALLQKGKQR